MIANMWSMISPWIWWVFTITIVVLVTYLCWWFRHVIRKKWQWIVKVPWGLFIKPIGHSVKIKISEKFSRLRTKVPVMTIKQPEKKFSWWLLIGVGFLVLIIWGLWRLALKVVGLGHTIASGGNGGWGMLWVLLPIAIAG